MKKAGWELRLLGALIYIAIAATAACCVLSPLLLRHFGFEQLYIGPLCLIGAAFIFALFQLRGILKNVAAGSPFSRRNVTYLNRIAGMCFVVALAALLMIFIYFSFLKILLVLLAAAGGLILRVLAWVFLLAAQQKEEMDLTI